MRTLIFLICIFPILAQAQLPISQRQYYNVEAFEGLNVVTDSIDMRPGEAIQLDNFVLDRFGALHKRYGIDVWNDSLVSADTIKDVHYVEDKNGEKNLFVATNNYIYELPGWTDTVDVWAGKEVDYTTGKVDASNGTKYIYGDTSAGDDMSWILVADIGDVIIAGTDTLTIDSILTDTSLHVSANSSAHADASYRLLKTVKGNPRLTSWNGNLYVADSRSDPWWYDKTLCPLLGIADSGFVDSVGATDAGEAIYNTGTVFVTRASNTVSTGTAVIDSFVVGDYFHIRITFERHLPAVYEFSSEILEIDGLSFHMADDIHGNAFYPPLDIRSIIGTNTELPFSGSLFSATWWASEIDIPRSSSNAAYIMDSTKTWRTNEFTYFWIVNGNDAKTRGLIGSNDKSVAYYDSSVSFSKGDKYYIVWQIPSMRNVRTLIGYGHGGYPIYEDSIVVNSVRFKQILFHRNRLYAIGEEISGIQFGDNNEGDTVATGRVWLSDLGMPTFIPCDFNFDISGAARSSGNLSLYSHDATQNMFTLRDDLYVATNSNIYRVSDEPVMGPEDLFVSQVVHGVGTNQPHGVITTKENIAFIMNQQGIWEFDGYNIKKISYRVDPLVEQYRKSRMVAGKFKDNLLFSYPDSGITLVMHDLIKRFTLWDVGMLTINDQSVAIDSNYFLFARVEDSAYIMKYPRDYAKYFDSWTPTDTVVVVARYLSGQITMGSYKNKNIVDVDITAYAVDAMDGYDFLNYLGVRADFADTSDWSKTAFSQTDPINTFGNIGVRGRAFQIQVKDSTDNDFFLSSYGIKWYPSEQ